VKGTTYKRCGCTDPQTGKRLGQSCPELRRATGGWSRSHGQWHWQIELPARADGTRRPLRHGTYSAQADAEADLDRVRAALTTADGNDAAAMAKVGDLIETAVKTGAAIPTPELIRRTLRLDLLPDELPTVGEYLNDWLAGRRNLKIGTQRSYEAHIRLYLTRYLGHLRLDRLRPAHIDAMYDSIRQHNETITAIRATSNPTVRETVRGQQPANPATIRKIHATLRKALNDAVRRHRIIESNPALMVELARPRPPRPTVWTKQRVTTWRDTGKRPSPVMIWTPEQTGAFLDYVHETGDRFYALFHLIVFTGLRRGEACGLHWDDVDLDAKSINVRWQIAQYGWETALDTPKTVDSEGHVAIDAETVAVLRAHRTRQHRERLAVGAAWQKTGLVFTTLGGGRLHPANITGYFQRLGERAGLPPIRLHDLRHGAATMALAAGVPMKVISARLRPLESALHRSVLRRRVAGAVARCRGGYGCTGPTSPGRRHPVGVVPALLPTHRSMPPSWPPTGRCTRGSASFDVGLCSMSCGSVGAHRSRHAETPVIRQSQEALALVVMATRRQFPAHGARGRGRQGNLGSPRPRRRGWCRAFPVSSRLCRCCE
jgi:integrase